MTWQEFTAWLDKPIDLTDPTIAAGVAVFVMGFVVGTVLVVEHKSPWHVLLGTFIQPVIPQV